MYTLGGQGRSLPGGALSLWAAGWLWEVQIGILVVVILLFPDGRLMSRRWRVVLGAAVLSVAADVVKVATAPGPLFHTGSVGFRAVDNPLGVRAASGFLGALSAIGLPIFLGSLVASLVALVLRFRRSRGEQRLQMKWFTYAGALLVVELVTELAGHSSGSLFLAPVAVGLLSGAIALAILKYRLYDIDLIINRTLVYAMLSLGVAALYVAVAAGLASVLQRRVELKVSLVAAAVVAVVFAPLRQRLQRGVDRLMYGRRDDPYGVISTLGRRLEETPVPEAVLPGVVATVADALRLPYVAVELGQGDDTRVTAHGRLTGQAIRLPLAYQGQPIGQLVVGHRSGEEGLSPSDRHLLEDLARQTGAAAYAVRLTTDLQRSRERLVVEREEERRRLRRDIHDGLGPTMAAVSMKADTVRNLVRSDPDSAQEVLAELKDQARGAIADIRRLVYDLRPPALDELGLVSALREQAAQFTSSTGGQGQLGAVDLTVTIDAPDELRSLPAAVEVAAYRIVTEALTNVARHASARRCVVRLSLNGALELEVADDGTGLASGHRRGVGLASMLERAAELGGTCQVRSTPGGTQVWARLPIPNR